MDGGNSMKGFKNKQYSVHTSSFEENPANDVTKSFAITNVEEKLENSRNQQNEHISITSNGAGKYFEEASIQSDTFQHYKIPTQNNNLKYLIKSLKKNNPTKDTSDILEKCNKNNSLMQDFQMLEMGRIEILKVENSITMTENEFSKRNILHLPYLVNSIYCYNSKDNRNDNKPTGQVNRQESSTSLSGNFSNFFKNVKEGCLPSSNKRNSDDDSGQNNNDKTRSKNPKMPISPNKTVNNNAKYNGPPKKDDRYGSLGKTGLQRLSKQRELEKLHKKPFKKPDNASSPIGKNKQELGKSNGPAGRMTRGQPSNAADTGEANRMKVSNMSTIKRPDSTKKESNEKLKPGQKRLDKPLKEDPSKGKLNIPDDGKTKEGRPEVHTATPLGNYQSQPSTVNEGAQKLGGEIPSDVEKPKATESSIRTKSGLEKSDLGKRPESSQKESDDIQNLDRKREGNPLKEAPGQGRLNSPNDAKREPRVRNENNLPDNGKSKEGKTDTNRPTTPIGKNQSNTPDNAKQEPRIRNENNLPDNGKSKEGKTDTNRPTTPIGKNQSNTPDNAKQEPRIRNENNLPDNGKSKEGKTDTNRPTTPIGKNQSNTPDNAKQEPRIRNENNLPDNGKSKEGKTDTNRPTTPIGKNQSQPSNDKDLSSRPKSGLEKSDSGKRPESSQIESNDTLKPGQRRQDKPLKEDPSKGKLNTSDDSKHEPGIRNKDKLPDNGKSKEGRPEIPTATPIGKYQSKPKSNVNEAQKLGANLPSDGSVAGKPNDVSKQLKSGPDKSDLSKGPNKESDHTSKLDKKRQNKPIKEDSAKVGSDGSKPNIRSSNLPYNEKSKEGKPGTLPPRPLSPATVGKETVMKKDTTDPKIKDAQISDNQKAIAASSENLQRNDLAEQESRTSFAINSKNESSGDDQQSYYDPEILREKLKNQMKMLREEGFYTDSEFDDMDDEIYETVMSYGAQPNHSKMSINSESSLSLPSLSTLSFDTSSNVVKDLWTVLRKRSRTELNVTVRPVKKKKDRPVQERGKITTIGEAQYVDYESTVFDLNLPTKYKVSTRQVEETLLMYFDTERKSMSGDKCFRLYKVPEKGRQIKLPINDQEIPVFIYETDNDPEGILVTDQIIRSNLQVCLEVANMYYDEVSVNRGRLLVHLAEYAPSSVIGFLRQLAEAVVNRRINSKAKINGFLNKVHIMSLSDRTILKKDLGDKPELDNFRLLSRLKTKVFSEFYRRVGFWELMEGEKEVSHKHLFLIKHMPRLYKTGLYPFIDFISEYIANNQIRTLDQLEVALIRFLVCSDGVITKSEFNTFCDFGFKKKC